MNEIRVEKREILQKRGGETEQFLAWKECVVCEGKRIVSVATHPECTQVMLISLSIVGRITDADRNNIGQSFHSKII